MTAKRRGGAVRRRGDGAQLTLQACDDDEPASFD